MEFKNRKSVHLLYDKVNMQWVAETRVTHIQNHVSVHLLLIKNHNDSKRKISEKLIDNFDGKFLSQADSKMMLKLEVWRH